MNVKSIFPWIPVDFGDSSLGAARRRAQARVTDGNCGGVAPGLPGNGGQKFD